MSIYKPCDIRGSAERELTPELYRSWGRTLARKAGGGLFTVGGDVRASTPPLLEGLVAGLSEAGAEVVDLGLLPTPMIYFAKRHFQATGCAIVTASHNPAEINGLKWMIGDRPANREQVDALREGAEGPSPSAVTLGEQRPATHEGVRHYDIATDYVAWLKSVFDPGAFTARVLLDPMSGCWADRAGAYLRAVFPGITVAAIHDTPLGDFGGRMPDSSRQPLLVELGETVRAERAELGIAFDGDGDRVAFVDGEGIPLGPEQATLVLLESFSGPAAARWEGSAAARWEGSAAARWEWPPDGRPFVHDLKLSDRVAEKATAVGATPMAERSGHAFIRTRMLETDAIFGAEASGHYFYGELGGGDDGLYTACRLLEYLGRSGARLADLRRECPPIHMTADLRVAWPPEKHRALIELVRAAWPIYPQSTIDGIRVDFPDGWALARSSVTEPALTFRFEASGAGLLSPLVRRYCDTLGKVGELLWRQYEGTNSP